MNPRETKKDKKVGEFSIKYSLVSCLFGVSYTVESFATVEVEESISHILCYILQLDVAFKNVRGDLRIFHGELLCDPVFLT